MNRKERKQVEKRLGLKKRYKGMSLNDRFDKIRQNIIDGKKREAEIKEIVRLQTNKTKDNVDSNKIASLATEFMVKDALSYIEALEKAKRFYEEETNQE